MLVRGLCFLGALVCAALAVWLGFQLVATANFFVESQRCAWMFGHCDQHAYGAMVILAAGILLFSGCTVLSGALGFLIELPRRRVRRSYARRFAR